MVALPIRFVGIFAVASVACAFTAAPLAPALQRSAVAASGSFDYLPHWRYQASVAMPRAAVVKAVAPRPGPAETGASVMSIVTALGTRNAVTATAAFVLAVIGASILRKRGEVRRLKRTEEKKGEKTVEKKAPPPKEVEKKVESKAGKRAEMKSETEASTILDFGAAIFGAAVDATVWAGTAIAEEGVKVLAEPTVAAEAVAMPKEQEEKEAAPEKVPEMVPAKVSAMDDTRAFIPTPKFAGPKKNFVFKAGPEGVGYYNRDYTWE